MCVQNHLQLQSLFFSLLIAAAVIHLLRLNFNHLQCYKCYMASCKICYKCYAYP